MEYSGRKGGLFLFLCLTFLVLSISIPSHANADSVTINGGAAYTSNNTVNLSIAYPAGTYSLVIYESGGEYDQISPTTSYSFPLTSTNGSHTVYVIAYYSYQYVCGSYCCGGYFFGNCQGYCPSYCTGYSSEQLGGSIILDTTLPTGTVNINSGATSTNSANVTLNLSASDNYSVVSMQLMNLGGSWSAPIAYASSAPWTLPAGDGNKIVYARFIDEAGNYSNVADSGILLDTTAPLSSATSPSSPLSKFTFTTIDGPSATYTAAYGINSAGEVVGGYKDASGLEHGFLLSGGSISSLDYPGASGPGGPPGTEIHGINDSGQMVGLRCACYYGEANGFYYSGGVFSPMASAPGSYATGAMGINNAGQIVGGYESTSYPWPIWGFLDTGGSFSQLVYPGSTYTQAYGINHTGQVVGSYYTDANHGFMLSGGNFSSIDYPGATQTYPYGINDAGQVVGQYTDSNSVNHGFTLSGGVYTTVDYPNATLTTVNGINNAGQIAGYYNDANGVTHGFSAARMPILLNGASAVITGTAADGSGSGVQNMEVSTDGGSTWLGPADGVTDTSGNSSWATWSYSWTLPADGSYTIHARSTDYAGNVETLGSGMPVTVDNTAPSSTITSPTSSNHPTGGMSYTITGTASDNLSGVQKVEISTDGGATWKEPVDGVTDTSGAGSWATWSYSWTPPLEGTFTIKSRATDMEGNVETPGAGVTVILVDKAPPVTRITAPANGAYLRGTSYNITGTSSDADGLQAYFLEIDINGGYSGWPAGNYPGALTGSVYTVSWSRNWTLPADGTYTITAAYARDSAGNIETPGPSVTVKVDNTPPVVSAGVDKTANSVFTQSATASDANSMTYSWSKVSGPGTITFGTPTALSTWVSASADGAYSLQFTATDAAGNSASSTMTLTWDTTAPTSTITAPSDPYISGTSCNISGTASDTGSGVQKVEVGITPNGGTTTWYTADGTTSWSYPWTFPADGSYTITTRAKDTAGNFETPSAGITVTVDNTSPTSSITAPAAAAILYGGSANITGTAADTGPGVQTVEVGITPNGGTTTWGAASGTTTWSFPWTLPAEGNYKIQTRATDKGNHVETPGSGISVTVDNSSPVITGPVDHAALQAQFSPDPPTFSWVPNACVKFKVAYSARPDFKKRLTVVSDNGGIGATYNPLAPSWNKITALGGNIFWRVVGTTAGRKVLNSASQQLVIEGTYSDISDIPSTDVNSIPSMECDPGASSSVRVEFSSTQYFAAPLKTPVLTSGSLASYTPTSAAWKTITKLGPEFYWRFMGKLSTGETSYSVTKTTSVTGGPTITDPADDSTVTNPLTISWDTTGFLSFVVQASAASDFSTKVLVLGSSKTGSLALTDAKWSKFSALGNPVYVRVVGTTEDKYTAYGPAVKVNAAP